MSRFGSCPVCGDSIHIALLPRHASSCSEIDIPNTDTKTNAAPAPEPQPASVSSVESRHPLSQQNKNYGPLRPLTSSDLGMKRKRGLSRAPSEYPFLVVLDFEWTCDNRARVNPHSEIIEFSCVLVQTTRPARIVDEFAQYCKPEHNPTLSAFCKKLTAISQEQVDNGVPLEVALSKFHGWLQCLLRNFEWEEDVDVERWRLQDPAPFVICTWSDADLGTTLPKQMQALNLKQKPWLSQWINLKIPFKSVYKKNARGLQKCVEKIGLKFVGRAHSGLVDAKNTAAIAIDLMNRQNYKFVSPTRYLEGFIMVGSTKSASRLTSKKKLTKDVVVKHL